MAIYRFIKSITRKGFFHLLSANLFIQVISFASQLFVADILVPEDIGRIKFIQTLISIFTIIGGLGLSASNLKICSEKNSEKYKQKIFSSAISFTLLGTIVSYFIIIILITTKIISKDIVIIKLASIAFIPIIFHSVLVLFTSHYQAEKKIKTLSYITIINKILSIFLIIIFTFYFGIYGYYYAMNIGLFLMVFALLLNKKKYISFNSNIKENKELLKKHSVYSLPALSSNLLSELTVYIDILFINIFLVNQKNEIGYYSFALTLTVIIRILPITVQQISNPYFSEKGNSKEVVNQLFKKYSKLLVLVIVATFLGFMIFVPLGLQYLFPKYIPSMAWSIRQFNQITAAALFGLGKINYTTYSQVISFIFNIIFIPICMFQWQLLGIAYGMIICSIFNVLIMYLFYKKAIK